MEDMHVIWLYNEQEFTDGDIGDYKAFVYVIENMINGKKYFGKKRLAKKVTKPPLKGTKRKRVTYSVSDYQTYYGSNEELKADVEEFGRENFTRTILHLCTTLGESSYYEAKYQFVNDVLKYPDKFYNSWIQCKIHRKHLPSTK
jgi:hypothetical protein